MNERKQRDEELSYIMKHKERMKAPKAAREKSLHAFQDGLKEAGDLQKTIQKRQKLHQLVIGSTATVAAAGIAGLLIFNTTFLQDEKPLDERDIIIGGGESREIQPEEHLVVQKPAIESDFSVEAVLDRPSFDHDDLNRMGGYPIFNNTFTAKLPSSWTVTEKREDGVHSVNMTGQNSESMKLLLFNETVSKDQFNDEIQKVTSQFEHMDQITLAPEVLIEELRFNNRVSFPHKEVFPFEIENARISVYIDEEAGRFIELYASQLFGYPFIYTAEFPLDNWDSSNLSWIFLTNLTVDTPFTIPGTVGAPHPEYGRSLEKSVVLMVGAMGYEQVDMKLFEVEELKMTGYLPRSTDVEKIEHQHFTEWRFTEPGVSNNSFYSFGKLKESFKIDQGKEIMFDAFNIDLAYEEDLGGGASRHYAYVSHMDEEFMDGHFQLFEQSGQWYYKHKHADREDYNGGVYFQRLDYFINSLEWH
ncbi:hypothetical protein [Alkalihalobacterium sp. APHAB7]|uniref:hypothetical protein n=1 Tax=Alkalihalobacterium sp. APHAB7 TaxID=3402081 RepID=UPI003AAF5A9C